jgi:glucose/arabinose dehydrogenase
MNDPVMRLGTIIALLAFASSQDSGQAQPPVARVPWNSSRVQGSPDPPPPYRTEPAFPQLKFATPTEITTVPGSNRLVVAEMEGKIYAFPNDPGVASADLLIDLQTSVYGVTFHPRFVDNGFMYVVNVHELAGVLQVSRFVVERGEHWHCPPASATVIFRWPLGKAGGHKGGALRFGLDGYLYIGTGDGEIQALRDTH